MKRVLCIWLPNWPIQRLVVARPELRGQVVILHSPDARRGECVAGCSTAASKLGVRVGMPLAEAISLADESTKDQGSKSLSRAVTGLPTEPLASTEGLPEGIGIGSKSQLNIFPHDWQTDREMLGQLAGWCEQFSPVVGLEQSRQPSCLLLDVTRLAPLFDGEQALASKVVAAFGQRGYLVHVAIADTIGAAWAVACFGSAYSVSLISPGKTLETLRPLPIEALRLPDTTVNLLRQLGVLTIAQLESLPRSGLSSRFGDDLLKRWDQATGAVQEALVAHHAPPALESHWSFEHPTDRREAIDRSLVLLVEQLVDLLTQQNQGAVQLLLQLDCVDRPAVRIEVGLYRPMATARHLLELVRMQLESLKLAGPVHHVSLRAAVTSPLEEQQYALLGGHASNLSRQLAQLINRLSGRLGKAAVVKVQLLAEAQAERAYRYVPLTGQQSKSRRAAASSRKTRALQPGQRPLRLHTPPLPLEVIAVTSGPPASFVHQRQQRRVTRHWGPERIETGWWRGKTIRRDYYRVEDEQGKRFWVFRSLEDGKWFLHGWFE